MRCRMRASDLTRPMAVLAKGDVLVITRFDRLARSTLGNIKSHAILGGLHHHYARA